MKRYAEGISQFDSTKLEKFSEVVNSLDWKLSRHATEKLQERAFNIVAIAEAVKQAKLEPKNCFEYYLNELENIDRAGFIIPYKDQFIKVVVNNFKNIVTLWIDNERGHKVDPKKYVA